MGGQEQDQDQGPFHRHRHDRDQEDQHSDSDTETETDDDDDERDTTRRRRILITVVSGRRSGRGDGGGGGGACCQADECSASLSLAKRYHRRHKVCERHAKAAVVLVAGVRQRFCQQCSRFHEILQFDGSKRSCRNRLAGHNERRRKAQPEEGSAAEGASLERKPSNKHFRTK